MSPPRFLLGEVVRATGQGFVMDRGPLAVKSAEGVVNGVIPTRDQRGWIYAVFIPRLGEVVDCPDDILEATGLLETRDGRIPRGPGAREWRDDVLIDLVTGASPDPVAIARHLRSLPSVDEVEWRVDGPTAVTLWVWNVEDALRAFAGILGDTTGWRHADDEVYLVSRWVKGAGPPFLHPDVREAEVAYRRLTDPRRRPRTEVRL